MVKKEKKKKKKKKKEKEKVGVWGENEIKNRMSRFKYMQRGKNEYCALIP